MFKFFSFENILNSFMSVSGEVCLIVGVSGFIFATFGWEKCKNLPLITFAVYLVMQVLGGFLV